MKFSVLTESKLAVLTVPKNIAGSRRLGFLWEVATRLLVTDEAAAESVRRSMSNGLDDVFKKSRLDQLGLQVV